MHSCYVCNVLITPRTTDISVANPQKDVDHSLRTVDLNHYYSTTITVDTGYQNVINILITDVKLHKYFHSPHFQDLGQAVSTYTSDYSLTEAAW